MSWDWALDVDDLYRSMQARGFEMIDRIQGPPAWDGPDVLLRQTSFRALAEPRRFREPDGSVGEGTLRVRFGEVEARGIALTPRGRDLYDRMLGDVDSRTAAAPGSDRAQVAREVWEAHLPRTERDLCLDGLAYFTIRPTATRPAGPPPDTLAGLLDGGWATAAPIVYEDFLPRSAAGIFASNLTGQGGDTGEGGGAHRDAAWLADAIGRPVRSPEALYAAQADASLAHTAAVPGIPLPARPATGGWSTS